MGNLSVCVCVCVCVCVVVVVLNGRGADVSVTKNVDASFTSVCQPFIGSSKHCLSR